MLKTEPRPALQPSPTVPDSPPPQRSFLRRNRRLGLGLLLALLAGGTLLLRFAPWSARDKDLAPYTVLAETGSLSGVITASGELQADRRVNISPRKQGLLKELMVEEGDVVEAGEVVALMDPGDYGDRLDERRALLRQAEANFLGKRDEFERRRQLHEQEVVSADDFIRVRNQMLASQAAVFAARERIQQLEEEGRELRIRAPFSGTITARFAEPGAFVTPTTTASANAGATSSSIVELSQGREVAAKVPESDIGRIALGQQAEIRVDAFPDERFQATTIEIAPRAEKRDNVTSFTVKLQLQDPPDRLRIGMTADINFQTGRSAPKTLVPTVAIVTENGKPGVLLVGEKQQPSFQKVELGSSSGDPHGDLEWLAIRHRVFIDLPLGKT